ncbi:MAG: tetratricopeptide repeat protein [Fimbriimonas sp.]
MEGIGTRGPHLQNWRARDGLTPGTQVKVRLARLAVIPLLFVGQTVLSHVVFVARGVHFKGLSVDFGLPPHRQSQSYSELSMDADLGAYRPGTRYMDTWAATDWREREERDQKREKLNIRLHSDAKKAERTAQYARARADYVRLLHEGLGDVAFLRERIAILDAVSLRPARGLSEWLRARPINAKDRFGSIPKTYDPRLANFVAYVNAEAVADDAKAADGLMRAAFQNPRQAWADTCLITASRRLLRSQRTPTEQDQVNASRALKRLIQTYPNSRFVPAAMSWLGRIDVLQGLTSAAQRRYLTVVAIAPRPERLRALESLAWISAREHDWARNAIWLLRRHRANDQGPGESRWETLNDFRHAAQRFDGKAARTFWRILATNVDDLNTFLDYRLDFTETTPDLVANTRRAAIGLKGNGLAHTYAALAEASLRLKRPKDAETFANQALRRNGKDEDKALATYCLATVAKNRGRSAEATASYRAVLRRYPKTYLVGAARENLALLAERRGDLLEALDHYQALDYDQDFAYMVDARLSIAQLETASRSTRPRCDEITYALGMRYLRRANLEEAERTFRRLPKARRLSLSRFEKDRSWWTDNDTPPQDPMITIRALRKLERAVARAKGSEAKATAKLRLAEYPYRKELLFYCPSLWDGRRAYDISFSWNSKTASSADEQALRQHHIEHDTYNWTLKGCEEIVRDYPKTRAAKHAAYRAATAARRLSNMNPYWRWQDERRDLMSKSIRYLRLASTSREPALAARAKKYLPVFTEERADKRKAFREYNPPSRKWVP